jgi:Flp pilus assembly pilin Flp
MLTRLDGATGPAGPSPPASQLRIVRPTGRSCPADEGDSMPKFGRLRAPDQRGQGLAEYAMILAFVAVMAIVAVTFLGREINALISSIANAM